MARYRIDLSYLGTDFHGWQSQPDGLSVQDHLNQALTTALRKSTQCRGASRTDSGVHAEHQVASFEAEEGLDTKRLRMSLSALLPDSVGVAQVARCDDDFHPITSAVGKLYRYRLWRNRMIHPFLGEHIWQVPETIDLLAMTEAARHFEGEQDFSSFAATDGGAKTFVRRLDFVGIEIQGALINVWFFGNGFLKQMVRNLVGTLFEVGVGQRTPESMGPLIAARDRTKAGRTAPAQGLSLVRVFYDQSFSPEDWLQSPRDTFSFDLSLFRPLPL